MSLRDDRSRDASGVRGMTPAYSTEGVLHPVAIGSCPPSSPAAKDGAPYIIPMLRLLCLLASSLRASYAAGVAHEGELCHGKCLNPLFERTGDCPSGFCGGGSCCQRGSVKPPCDGVSMGCEGVRVGSLDPWHSRRRVCLCGLPPRYCRTLDDQSTALVTCTVQMLLELGEDAQPQGGRRVPASNHAATATALRVCHRSSHI